MACRKWQSRETSGSTLLIVLIFCLIMTLITHAMLETAWLQAKMVSSYQSFRSAFLQASDQLIDLENELKNIFFDELPNHVSLLQFVPDTLHFGEQEGENVYLVKSRVTNDDGTEIKLSSTIGLRKKVDHSVIGMTHSGSELIISHFNKEGQIKDTFVWRPAIKTQLSSPVYSQQLEKFYIMSDHLVLYAIDKWGQEIKHVDLLKLLNLAHTQDIFINSPNQHEFLFLSEEILDGKYQQLLAVHLPLIHQRMVIFKLSDNKNKMLAKLWDHAFPEEDKIHHAAFVRLKNNTTMLTVILEHQKNILISLYDQLSGVKRREWILLSTSNLIMQSNNAIKLTAVDSLELGFVNRIYLGDTQGQLWRIEVENFQPKRVFYNREYVKHFVGKPIVGRDPEGKGVIVYILGINSKNELILYAIADEEKQIPSYDPLFSIITSQFIFPPLLRQNDLLFFTSDAIYVYDSFSGEKRFEHALYNVTIDTNQRPFIVQRKPFEKNLLIINANENEICMNEIPMEQNLFGRKTWNE